MLKDKIIEAALSKGIAKTLGYIKIVEGFFISNKEMLGKEFANITESVENIAEAIEGLVKQTKQYWKG